MNDVVVVTAYTRLICIGATFGVNLSFYVFVSSFNTTFDEQFRSSHAPGKSTGDNARVTFDARGPAW